MYNINNLVETYLSYCQMRKRLDIKTVRAYRADLSAYSDYLNAQQADFMDKNLSVSMSIPSIEPRLHVP